MKIPIPFEDVRHVTWFAWSDGLEFTYLTKNGALASIKEKDLKNTEKSMSIDDVLVKDGPFSDNGYPLRGSGYVSGYSFKGNKTYADCVITSRYNSHVQIEVGENGLYDGGTIIFPPVPSMETDEQKRRIASSSYFKAREE